MLCFIEQLKKLKESSKEAVENIDTFSSFKDYMHITRLAQEELWDLIMRTKESKHSQLILVCGGVGDGKSHLISYFIKNNPDIMAQFKIHNDATESFEPEKTSIDTLNDVLNAFSDENLMEKGVSEKLILAINLGTLNNFIDSSYGNRYLRLIEYVRKNKILESIIVENSFNDSDLFQYINFSDYHMFTLTEKGVKSDYIYELINKVTVEDDNNPFYSSYKNYCSNCYCRDNCPIRLNYEFLMSEQIKTEIINFLIEAMIKEKLIVSTRSLLNFIYDCIVPNNLDSINIEKIKGQINNIKTREIINFLMPNLIFEHKDLSNIFEILERLDPITNRSEITDQLIIKLNTIEKVSLLFREHINLVYKDKILYLLDNDELFKSQIEELGERELKDFKDQINRFFIRMYRLSPKNKTTDMEDDIYIEYLKNLYWWNNQNKKELRSLFEKIKDALFKWNGPSIPEYINFTIGKNNFGYKISQKINLLAEVSEFNPKTEQELYKFIPFIVLKYKSNDAGQVNSIILDFSLYRLLMEVRDGYRPNKKDKYDYISFVDFLERILKFGNQDKELIIQSKSSDATRYRLSYDAEFDQYSFEEIKGWSTN